MIRARAVAIAALCALAGGARRASAQTASSAPVVRAESLDAPSLGRRAGYQVVLPPHYDAARRYPVLWLLHGYGGNGGNWLQRTKLVDYVARDPFIVVLPSADDSWYANAAGAQHARYADLVMHDVYDDVRRRYPVDTTRQAIAGLSMGGYGAVTLALQHPGRFRFAGALSGAFFTRDDLEHPDPVFASLVPSLRTAFGDPASFPGSRGDPFALAARTPAGSLPYVYLTIGTSDGYRTFLPRNRALADTLRAHRAAYEYHERAGAHAWTFWDPELGALMDRAWAVVTDSTPPRVAIALDTLHPVTFDPRVALGSTIDGHMQGATAHIFAPKTLAAMKSANFHPISYRIRTELAIEAWHWNPRGRWSDAAHAQGYWTSDDVPRAPIRVSYGYRLPRRGSTMDQANEDGWSRIDDGSTATFWKSNPYLDERFTREPNDRHPQWVLIDLDDETDVGAIRIAWGAPYATRYDVQYWDGPQPRDPDDDNDGTWRTFPGGAVTNARGGTVTLRLSATPVRTRWLRVLMHESSHTAERGARDPRDSVGYAVRELYAGTIARDGTLHDVIRHAPKATRQTRIIVSSTDPWHRAIDRDPNVEQPGVDLMFSSGITRGLPMLLPVGVLYDTPENGAALLRYVHRRGYPVPRIELGEEPDGQYASPDDFAALYLRVADSLHAVDPAVQLGGPSFQSNEIGSMMSWKQGTETRPWFARFMDVVHARKRAGDVRFLSFEWYPFDSVCTRTEAQLATTVPRLARSLERFHREGLPAETPILITEYGYSAFAGAPEVTRAGAILNTETVAAFLTLGGSQAFFYGTEPSSLDRNAGCESWGDNTLFVSDDQRNIGAPTATYRAARLLTTMWADSAGGAHTLYRARAATSGAPDSTLPIAAYPVRRPDGAMAWLLINRDSTRTWSAALPARGTLDAWQLSAAEYQWHPNGPNGYAKPNVPPREFRVTDPGNVVLPPYSITVVREGGGTANGAAGGRRR